MMPSYVGGGHASNREGVHRNCRLSELDGEEALLEREARKAEEIRGRENNQELT